MARKEKQYCKECLGAYREQWEKIWSYTQPETVPTQVPAKGQKQILCRRSYPHAKRRCCFSYIKKILLIPDLQPHFISLSICCSKPLKKVASSIQAGSQHPQLARTPTTCMPQKSKSQISMYLAWSKYPDT